MFLMLLMPIGTKEAIWFREMSNVYSNHLRQVPLYIDSNKVKEMAGYVWSQNVIGVYVHCYVSLSEVIVFLSVEPSIE